MNSIKNIITERLHITKKTTPFVDLIELNEYKGVNIISPSISIEEWKKFSKVDIDIAYKLLQIIIDNLHDELKGYTLTLFYSGYTGFSVKEDKNSTHSIGFILFENNKYISELKGKGCYFSEALGNKVSIKLKNFIGPLNKEFNKIKFNYITERLHINNNTKVINARYYFNEYYSSVPKKTLDYIWDNYVTDWPMSEEAQEVTTASAFELLFTMACCLIDDALGCEYYKNLGTTWYKQKLHGKNNPYDWAWFEEEIDEDNDMLDECKNWIEKHYAEFNTIYNWCKKYHKDFNLEKIDGFYTNVYDK